MSPQYFTLFFHVAIVFVYATLGVYVLLYGIAGLSPLYSQIFGVALLAYAAFRIWRARRNQLADEAEDDDTV